MNNETAFWNWFKNKNACTSFKLISAEEGYAWSILNSKGEWEESDMWFDTPYDALIDFFSHLICCTVVSED